VEIEEKFFKHIAKDEQDLDIIRARGEANMKDLPETPGHKMENYIMDLPEGNYSFTGPNINFTFKLEVGGIIAGDNINGSI